MSEDYTEKKCQNCAHFGDDQHCERIECQEFSGWTAAPKAGGEECPFCGADMGTYGLPQYCPECGLEQTYEGMPDEPAGGEQR